MYKADAASALIKLNLGKIAEPPGTADAKTPSVLPSSERLIKKSPKVGKIYAHNICSFPSAILENIFSYVSIQELILLHRVCKTFKLHAERKAVWKAQFEKRFHRMDYPELLLGSSTSDSSSNNIYKSILKKKKNSQVFVVIPAPSSVSSSPSTKIPAKTLFSIQGAVGQAQDGDIIIVKPGIYNEEIEMQREIELVGDGPKGSISLLTFVADPFVRNTTPILQFHSPKGGRVSNLTLSAPTRTCVSLSGSVVLESCDIRGAVKVTESSNVTIRKNKISSSDTAGIMFLSGYSQGKIEYNEICNNNIGILVASTNEFLIKVSVENNVIYSNLKSGVYVTEFNAVVTFIGNEIYDNLRDGIKVGKNAKITLRNNFIHNNLREGVKQKGLVFWEDGNKIIDNLGSSSQWFTWSSLFETLSSIFDIKQHTTRIVLFFSLLIVSFIRLFWKNLFFLS